MLENTIEYGGGTVVIDGCVECSSSKEYIEHLVKEVNEALMKGEMSIQGAYYNILVNLGVADKVALALSWRYIQQREITLLIK